VVYGFGMSHPAISMNKSILSLVGAVDSLIFLLEFDRTARRKPGAIAVRRRLERLRQNLLSEGLRQVKVLGNARDTIWEVSAQLSSHLSAPGATREIEWVMRSLSSELLSEVDPPPLPSSSSSSNGPLVMDPGTLRLAETLTNILLHATSTQSTALRSESRSGKNKKGAKAKRAVVARFPDGKTVRD